jgi:hypothetical protein
MEEVKKLLTEIGFYICYSPEVLLVRVEKKDIDKAFDLSQTHNLLDKVAWVYCSETFFNFKLVFLSYAEPEELQQVSRINFKEFMNNV